ncbi:MAG: hypothetical protein MJZ30_10990 [Paludibacteraceae bacterium]|nr:hypothetical protein [Paludibacteraceae bacterium]
MKMEYKRTVSAILVLIATLFVSSQISAQEYIYYYNKGEISKKTSLSDVDSIRVEDSREAASHGYRAEGSLLQFKDGVMINQTPTSEVDSIALEPMMKVKHLLLTQLNVSDTLSFLCHPDGDVKMEDLSWTSSDNKIAEVESGVVTSRNYGNCIITGKYKSREISCVVTVADLKGHDYVDLGLPSGTLWATTNLGSTLPEKCGSYYAWGEAGSKPVFSKGNSAWYEKDMEVMMEMGVVDENYTLKSGYDAATTSWGKFWRMPTSKEFDELLSLKFAWTTLNNQKGVLITGYNGNTLFLPSSGGYDEAEKQNPEDHYYWTSSAIDSDDWVSEEMALCASSYWGQWFGVYSHSKYIGAVIRPVLNVKNNAQDTLIAIDQTDLILMDIDSPVSLGFSCFPTGSVPVSRVRWSSSDEKVAVVKNGIVTPVGAGECLISGYYKMREVTCKVKVEKEDYVLSDEEYVDLGLPSGTLWATRNISALDIENPGLKYAWGEVADKITFWTNNYSFYRVSTTSLYQKGVIDDYFELTGEYDAATVKLGKEWRMPNQQEFEELFKECKVRYIKVNDCQGALFKGPNNKYLFLTSYEKYWTSSITSGSVYYANAFRIDRDTCYIEELVREGAGLIRPVRKKPIAEGVVISIDKQSITMTEGNGPVSLGYTSLPERAVRVSDVEWLSSDETVAIVKSGMVFALDKGVCTITGKLGDQIVSCDVTVNAHDIAIGYDTVRGVALSPDFSLRFVSDVSVSKVEWSSSDEQVALVKNGMVQFLSKGECVVTGKYKGNEVSCVVIVDEAPVNRMIDGHEYVDLKLPSGTLWATANLGASSSSENGNFYAWGEVSDRTEFGESEWMWNKVSYDELLENNVIDTAGNLTAKYDAVTTAWGAGHAIPTREQFLELVDNCTFKEATLRGVKGLICISNLNDNFIFFPLAGFRESIAWSNEGVYGYYWSATYLPSNAGSTYMLLDIYRYLEEKSGFARPNSGFTIRAVYK